ncbi:helix-turn-helix transcriptional regulator [Streptomyces sp. NPDC047070]|uniref:helix-turn-helix transcriptional regulator n=1 Tax=Streptomyces sp. NPDC047070 TaxID=3154923 RepID=UPI003453ADC5
MSTEVSAPAWRIGNPSTPVIDVTVPYANENRNGVLLREWRRQAGESVPAPPMRLPRHSEGTYRARIWKQDLLDLFLEDQHSDAVAGVTGGPNGHLEDRIVTSVTLSGEWGFTAGGRRATAAAGTLCVRRNECLWDFEVAAGTRAITLVLPASEIRFPKNTRAVTADQESPAAALLLAHLRLWTQLADGLGAAASGAARNAALELFRGLLNDQVIDDAEFAPALLGAAMDHIEARLLADPDLGPGDIAAALNVSVRTLYRAFGQGGTSSVMAYVRERRLDRARAELLSTRLTVSEIAARWHFADSSHFVKAYKKRFAETPTARR